MKKLVTLLLAFVMIFSLVSCKKTDETKVEDDSTKTEVTEEQGETEEDGAASGVDTSEANTMTVGCEELQGLLTPLYYTSSYDGWVVDLVFQTLVNRDEKGLIVPGLATWDISEDQSKYTFHIDPNVVFSDGTPVTAKDVEFSFKALAHPEYDGRYGNAVENIVGAAEYSAGTADSISGIEIIDDKTISFAFVEPIRANIENFTKGGMCGILSVDYYGDNGEINFEKIKSLNETPLGSGPYKLEQYEAGQFISLVRNDKYTGEGYAINKVVIKAVSSITDIDELVSGSIDVLPGTIEPEKLATAEATGFLNLVQYPRSGYGYIKFNTHSPITSDVKVRQALAYAYDGEKFVQDFFEGLAVTQPVPMSQVSWAYTDELKSKLNNYEYDPEKAGQLLDEAGWTMGSDGIREKDGQRLVINFPAMPEHSILDVLVPMIKEEYAAVGVELNITYVDFNPLMDIVYSERDDWDMFFMANNHMSADPDDAYSAWHSKFIGNRMDNTARFNDAKNDELLEKGRKEFDVEKAKTIYEEWATNINEKMPIIIVYANLYTDIVNNKIKNLNTDSLYQWPAALKDARIEIE